ncbi:MAG: hypothetical protein ACTSV5_10255 [Promethearchaeota archaeon]
MTKKYTLKGVDGGTTIIYGEEKTEQGIFYYHGNKHRKEGPAVTIYAKNGNLLREEYYINDSRHRINGPAYIEYDYYGEIFYEAWWINGKKLNEDETNDCKKNLAFNEFLKEELSG